MDEQTTESNGTTADEGIEVSFAEVAEETPDESVAHEADLTDDLTDDPGVDGDVADPAVHEDNAAPTQPTISSVYGGGPVSDGSELAP